MIIFINFSNKKQFKSSCKKVEILHFLFLINNLKATFHYCFGQYKLFNNIVDDLNLSTTYYIDRYNEKNFINDGFMLFYIRSSNCN